MLTVLLATHNGADTIGRTLDAFAELIPPNGGWKLVVVNNASTDASESIILARQHRLPLEYVIEPGLGKPRAINSGMARFSGDLLVMTDDDVLPDPTWLAEWRRVADAFPEITVFGGSIKPEFEADPPGWLARTNWSRMLYGATPPDWREGPVTPDAAEVFGGNWAIRRVVVESGLRFNERLMVGSAGRMGDETDFVDRAMGLGFRVGLAPNARVRHIVSRRQMTWGWMLTRFFRHGRRAFAVSREHDRGNEPAEILSVPRYLIMRIALRCAALPIAAASCSALRLMSHLRLIAYDLGAAREARALAQAQRKQR